MRIHSNVISYTDIANATQGLQGVYASASQHKSRTHKAAFEVSMTGNSFYGRNTGKYGQDNSNGNAATWDEWGVFLGRLYVIDPEMVVGNAKNPIYASAEHFHWSTGNRFLSGMSNPSLTMLPADTHPRHKWEYQGEMVTGAYYVHACKKCSAIRRFMAYGRTFDELGLVSA